MAGHEHARDVERVALARAKAFDNGLAGIELVIGGDFVGGHRAGDRDVAVKIVGMSGAQARDGAAGLDLVLRERPDLVLTDVVMPHMNGFELCRRLKDDRDTRLIPVVLVTGLAERADRIEGINAGADDFLTKPFDAHELKARVRSLVRLKRFTDDLDRADSVILSLGLTVEARDNGPGIADVEKIFAGSYRSNTGLGFGLRGVKNIANEFAIHSTPGQGTRIKAVFYSALQR